MANQLSQATLKINMDEPARLFMNPCQFNDYIDSLIEQDKKKIKARSNNQKRSWWHG